MKSRIIILSILLIGLAVSSYAIPADKRLLTKKQSNGKSISFTLNGDEFIAWANSIDGYTLIGNTNGELVYAMLNEKGDLVASSYLATNPQERTQEDKLFLNTIKPNLFYSNSQLSVFKQNRQERAESLSIERAPTTGTPNFLVILVSFSDIAFNQNNATTMQNQISQTNYTANGATGSVKDYFFDNSMGLLNANFTVVGPYTLPHSRAYYGTPTIFDHDTLPQQMAYDAVNLANNAVNFANFDNDNDGYVDMIHIVYAGLGQHNGGGANAIWAHAWVFGQDVTLDNTNLFRYSCSPELKTAELVDGIGTMCHEMGHVLGLPDFYDTDYANSGGYSVNLDDWDLMSSGGYNNGGMTPPSLTGLEREILNWITPTELNSNTYCTLPAISDSNKVYRINLTTNEFFMLEHRNKKKWDAYTSGKGMLVMHGDMNKINAYYGINTDPNDRGFFIVPAYGDSANITSTSTTFPGSMNVSSFINSKLKNGTPTGKALSNIQYGTDSVITFNYINNSVALMVNPATNITNNSATLNGTATGQGISSMGFEYRVTGTSNYTQQIVTSSPLSYNLTGLNSMTTYEYRVFAITSSGTFYSVTETFTTGCGTAIQLPYNYGFESGLTCWISASSNNDFITIVSSSSYPNCNPHTGNSMIKYNAYNIYDGNWASIASPIIHFPHQYYKVGLWVYRYNSTYSNNNEGIEIYINSNPNLTGATLIGFISNDRTAPPIETSDGWYNYNFNVPANTIGSKHIILKAKSNYGYNIYADDLSITLSQTVATMVNDVAISSLSGTNATFNSSFVQGTDTVLSCGFMYKPLTSTNWTTINSANVSSSFFASVSNLTPGTTYQVKAFVSTTSSSLTTGQTLDFQIPPMINLGVVVTDTVVWENAQFARLQGEIISTGGATNNIEIGFVYSKQPNPLRNTANTQEVIVPWSNGMISFNAGINTENLTTYYYKAFIHNQAGISYGNEITFVYLNDLNDISKESINIQLYPNPSNDATTLLINGAKEVLELKLTDLQGRTLKEEKLTPIDSKAKTQIDISNISQGIYLLKVTNSSINQTIKLIKN
jgi:M6 family metalloprotease-like protein